MVQYNPENRQIGFDADEEYMVAFGFSSGPLINSSSRKIFDAARRARDAANGNKWEHDRMRDGDTLWVDVTSGSEFTTDVFRGLKNYLDTNLNALYLEATPPFDPNALNYKRAELAREKVMDAMTSITVIEDHIEATVIQ
ncbi:MAG: hypothetical protein ACREGB_02920 [Candidatus Saccharimonadales bacterium]